MLQPKKSHMHIFIVSSKLNEGDWDQLSWQLHVVFTSAVSIRF